MRILVCGGREYTNYQRVGYALDLLLASKGPFALIHGDARGADRTAAQWARINRLEEISAYPAEWDAHGKAAGAIRNQRMLDDGKPDAAVAFPGGTGTADMVRRLRAASIPVWIPYGGVQE